MANWRLTFDCLVPRGEVQRFVVVKAEGERCIIGRSRLADIPLQSDAISREHCYVTLKNGEALIEDSGSTGGTWLNGQKIRGPASFKPGDVVFAGQPKLTLISIEPA